MSFKKAFLFNSIILSVFFFVSCAKKADFNLDVPGLEKTEETYLVSNKAGSMNYWCFNKKEYQLSLSDFVSLNTNGSLVLTISVKKCGKNNSDFSEQIGFLYEEDFVSENKISKNLNVRPLVSLNLSDFVNESFKVSFSFSKESRLPWGFFLNSNSKYTIQSAEIQPAKVGFDFSKELQFYGFAPNGGKLVKNSKKIDLSGLPMCFASHNTETNLMPYLAFAFSEGTEPVEFTAGGERITVRNGGSDILPVPVASLKSPYTTLEITKNEQQINSILAELSDRSLLENSSFGKKTPVNPIKVDPGLIIKWPSENWRGSDYELFEWDRFEGILFFDTADYSVQNDFFRRLAYFVEKQGFKGRLLTDSELDGKHGYNAHDYRAKDLARFFEKARVLNFKLNQKELLLREILLKNGVILQDEKESFIEGRGAVISISQESPLYLRTTFVAHEGWHGIYFVDEDFRNITASVYYSLLATNPGEMAFLVKYFQVTPTLNYDTTDDFLMKNEFMAYMLQRPVSQIEKYYTDMASREHAQYMMKDEADYLLSTKASGFQGAAQMFEDYVLQRWNLAAGRVWLLSR